jgi:type VI secretion system protein ImpH
MGKFRICLGPMGVAAFLRFLPDGPDALVLHRLVKFFAPDTLCFEWKLSLFREEAPMCRLESRDGVRLGWSTWLGTPSGDHVDVVLQQTC